MHWVKIGICGLHHISTTDPSLFLGFFQPAIPIPKILIFLSS